MYNAEMYDIDEDGLLDLIIGGMGKITIMMVIIKRAIMLICPFIIWGDGGFNSENYSRLPKTPISGFGVVNDFYFSDIDNDGQKEIFVLRTSDEYWEPNHVTRYSITISSSSILAQ